MRRIAVTMAAIAAAAVVLPGCHTTTSTSGHPSAGSPRTTRTSMPGTPSPPATPTTSTLPAPSSPGGGSATSIPLLTQGYLPLFPFADFAHARAWERGYPSGGHQPWHLDTAQTTLAFARYLGFNDLDVITATMFRTAGAHVGIGFRGPNGVDHTAAIVHLMRFGTDEGAPWEVVGTDDTTFTFDVPAYGATVPSPVTVGGVITGIDENISVTARQLATPGTLGRFCCLPVGGNRQPWSAQLAYAGAAPGGILTLAAATGEHLRRVERFAVTGVRG